MEHGRDGLRQRVADSCRVRTTQPVDNRAVASRETRRPRLRSEKWRNLTLLSLAILLSLALWFSASAVLPQLIGEWQLDGAAQSWMTMSVQIGFVVGALLSALLNLPDRFPTHRLFAVSAAAASLANAGIPLLAEGPGFALVCRFVTGAASLRR